MGINSEPPSSYDWFCLKCKKSKDKLYEPVKTIKCDKCDMVFGQQSAWKSHRESITYQTNSKSNCTMCSFKACNDAGLAKHRTNVHKNATANNGEDDDDNDGIPVITQVFGGVDKYSRNGKVPSYLDFDLNEDPKTIAQKMVEGVNIPGKGLENAINMACPNFPKGWCKKVFIAPLSPR